MTVNEKVAKEGEELMKKEDNVTFKNFLHRLSIRQ